MRSLMKSPSVLAVATAFSVSVCPLFADSLIVSPSLSPHDREFVEDMERRAVLYFWEQGDRGTGLVSDRAGADGGRAKGSSRDVASIAATGFGLTAICIGVEHGWITRDQAIERVRAALEFLANKADSEHGWFYLWMNSATGERTWDSETSSVDTAFLLGGVLTSGAYFAEE